MRCKKILSCLNAYEDGELSERLSYIVESHLATCESCRGRLGDIRGIEELLQGSLTVPSVPDGFAARIMVQARKRQQMRIPERRSPLPVWNPLLWFTELSMPMRFAACATVLIAIVAGVTLDGRSVTGRNVLVAQRSNLYGLEWFEPAPPGSIASIYIAMADQPYEKGTGQ